jgi:hypothetical protein
LIVFRSKPSAGRLMLLLLRLPSELRCIREQHWHLHLEFAHVDRIGADDSQDLLIFSSSVLNSKFSYSRTQLAVPPLVYQTSTFGHSQQEEFIL